MAERSDYNPFHSVITSTSYDGSAITTSVSQVAHNIRTEYFRRDSSNTPGYRHLKKIGARLPMRALREEFLSQSPIVASGKGGSRSGVTWLNREGHTVHDMDGVALPEGFASLNAELTLKALNKAKQSSFNAPIFLAEAGKTTDMILNRLADIRGLARDLRRGDIGNFLTKSKILHEQAKRTRPKKVKGLPGEYPGLGNYPPEREVRRVERKFNRQFGRDAAVACGNTWLEWKYGWMSVMMDIKGLAETIDDVRSKDANLDGRIKTSLTRRTFTEGPYSVSQTPNINGVRRDTLMLKGTLTCRFRMNNPDLLLAAKLGLTNPLSVAWELIPFSFVVDWFLPIGKFIDALDVNILYTFTDKVLVNTGIFHREVEVKHHDQFNYSVSGTGNKLVKVKIRDSTSMALSFDSLNFKNGFANPERIFTSLALLGQSLAGFSHPSTR